VGSQRGDLQVGRNAAQATPAGFPVREIIGDNGVI
jgi:hypothetical protein